jgi:hypothetical protein
MNTIDNRDVLMNLQPHIFLMNDVGVVLLVTETLVVS